MPHAVVAGAGIGGLAAGVALERAGWTVTVCERAARLEPVGSGLAIAPNALRALDTLDLGADVRRLSAMRGEGGLRRPDGRWLSRTSAGAARERFGDDTVLMLRSALVDLLAARLTPDSLRLGTTVRSADPATGTVTTSAGDLDADLVVAADGVRSPLRAALFPGHPGPVYAGETTWRLVVPRPDGPFPLSETWGRGRLFGITALAGDLMYCYAAAPALSGATAGDEKAELLRLFGSWHDPIPRLIAAVEPKDVIRTDLYCLDTPPPAFHQGRVALLGDAAHAMTPNLGQGACQAIEDAVVLAHSVTKGGGLPAYSAARLARTWSVVERSRRIGRLSRWSNPVAVAAREALLRLSGLLGPNVALRQFDDIFGWRPPA